MARPDDGDRAAGVVSGISADRAEQFIALLGVFCGNAELGGAAGKALTAYMGPDHAWGGGCPVEPPLASFDQCQTAGHHYHQREEEAAA